MLRRKRTWCALLWDLSLILIQFSFVVVIFFFLLTEVHDEQWDASRTVSISANKTFKSILSGLSPSLSFVLETISNSWILISYLLMRIHKLIVWRVVYLNRRRKKKKMMRHTRSAFCMLKNIRLVLIGEDTVVLDYLFSSPQTDGRHRIYNLKMIRGKAI